MTGLTCSRAYFQKRWFHMMIGGQCDGMVVEDETESKGLEFISREQHDLSLSKTY